MDDDTALRLTLYEQAVQHPDAELALLLGMYAHHHREETPTRFREDFAASAALAARFVAIDENHRALAVEIDPAIAAFARDQAAQRYPERADDLHVVADDVVNVYRPRVDLTCSLNFSSFIYHSRAQLRGYFRSARRGLGRGGVLVVDLFGGPGAQRVMTQRRTFDATLASDGDGGQTAGQVTYIWEQREFDAATGRIDCRISFALGDGRRLEDAFVYDWRLWSIPEMCEVLAEAGFRDVTVWCDRFDPATGQSDGHYQPARHLPTREDWIAYISARR